MPSSRSPAAMPGGAEALEPLVVVERPIKVGMVDPVTVTGNPAAGGSRLPLSSTARLWIEALIGREGVHAYVQLLVPVAGCQLLPPSTETSTPATTPPPWSAAVPLIVTVEPGATLAPLAGDVLTD